MFEFQCLTCHFMIIYVLSFIDFNNGIKFYSNECFEYLKKKLCSVKCYDIRQFILRFYVFYVYIVYIPCYLLYIYYKNKEININ